jgi:N6-L-threonylcarbamoyladenine synthase
MSHKYLNLSKKLDFVMIQNMKILSIETSCDETALSLIKDNQLLLDSSNFKVLLDLVISQIDIHAEYGGVFPALAKREHAKNLPILLKSILDCNELTFKENSISDEVQSDVFLLLEREPGLAEKLLEMNKLFGKPDIGMLMVTYGPGLTPALWVGINFARTLSILWNIPIIPVNHMQGHIASIILKENYLDQEQALSPFSSFSFPMISLLISGGHTQLVLVKNWSDYEILGETIDDAVGEAFDKVARMLDMTYPGGPLVSKAAQKGKENNLIKFPRPMLHSGDFRFSFSGLKTSVRYKIRDLQEKNLLDEQMIADIAYEFEHSVAEVLTKKTFAAIEKYNAVGLIIAGGVSANTFIIKEFQNKCLASNINIYTPEKKMCGDNSLMIATAGIINYWNKGKGAFVPQSEIVAVGNLKL